MFRSGRTKWFRKSTLSRIILGLEKPTNGTVRFDGVDLYHANAKEKIAFVEIYRLYFKIAFIHLIPSKRSLK